MSAVSRDPRSCSRVAAEVVHLRGSGLGGVALVVDLVGPLADPGRALVVEDVRGADGVGAEDGREGGVAGGLRLALERDLQLPGEGFDADEVALGVVGADPELGHELGGFLGRVGHPEQHGAERGAGVGAEEPGGRERGEGACGLLDRQPHLGCDEAGLLQRHGEVGDVALGLSGRRPREGRRRVGRPRPTGGTGSGRWLRCWRRQRPRGRRLRRGRVRRTVRRRGMSFVETPALASSSIAPAASVAENTVSAPALMAASRSRSMLPAVSCVAAWTFDMACSKFAARDDHDTEAGGRDESHLPRGRPD
jgi:hypothetical protein